MTPSIVRFREIDDNIFETIKISSRFIQWFYKDSPIPKTSELCWMYMTTSDFLKNSIFDCVEKENVYSCKVLMRALLEHFLRFNYIHLKYVQTNEDCESQKFYSIMEISDSLKMLKSIKSGFSILGDESLNLDYVWEEFCVKFPKYKTYNKKDVEKWVNELSIRGIMDYILKEMNKANYPFENNVIGIILEYSNFSSFVHGGVYAYKNTLNLIDKEQRSNEVIRIMGLALIVSSTIKYLSYLTFAQYKDEFINLYTKVDRLIKEIK